MKSQGVASDWLQKLYPLRGTFSAVFLVMWEVPQSGSGDEIEAGIFCLLFCAFLLATSPIWVAILFFSRNYKDPN
jgi:hypothetical protein